MLHRGGGPQDGDPQIAADVLDGLGGVAQALHDVLDVLAGQLVQHLADSLGALELLADLLIRLRAGVHVHDGVFQFFQLAGVIPQGQCVKLQLLPESFPRLIHNRLGIHQSIRFRRFALIDRFLFFILYFFLVGKIYPGLRENFSRV